MSVQASPDPALPSGAFHDLCARYDGLLADQEVALSKAARIDLRAFARLYDLALEEAGDAEVWRQVRRRLMEDLSTPLQAAAEWGYEGQRQAA